MTELVRRFLKTAIGFLAMGLAIGAWMMVRRELAGEFPLPYVVSAHTHALLVGFVMMMILGVALWMFPRPDKQDVRYNPKHAEVAYWLIALGTVVRVLGELMRASRQEQWLPWAIVIAGFAQIAGLAVFFHTMWSRIRALGSSQREARGEKF